MAKATVTVRMYNTGFGDAFLVTVAKDDQAWRMLVDCGVHQSDHWRKIDVVVDQIIADLSAVTNGKPHLDVVVATHRHLDHIAGFALDAWSQVSVGEVWVPFVENPDDPATKALQRKQDSAVHQIRAFTDQHLAAADGDAKRRLAMAAVFAANSERNAPAMRRLLNSGFKGRTKVRFMPDAETAKNDIDLPIDGARIHVIGPTRIREGFNRDDPPAKKEWPMAFGTALKPGRVDRYFDASYERSARQVDAGWVKSVEKMRLERLLDPSQAVLDAAAAVEWTVNNTSVMFVLDVGGRKLLFVGDAQQNAWERIMEDPRTRELISDVDFYKIGHHGSHNATTKDYVDEALGSEIQFAMMGWRKDIFPSIPRESLLRALRSHGARVIKSQTARADTKAKVTTNRDLWSQVTLTAKW